MKTKSNNNPSKLQSEAVKEFKSKYPKYKYLCRYSDDFKKGEWINIEDVFKFYNDQIQKAYSKGREEVLKVIKENHLIEVNNHSDKHLIGNWSGLKHNLSIQSKIK